MTFQPPDHAQRQAAIRERDRNVWIDAGAGTGKTSTLVNRVVNLIAPLEEATPLALDRIAVLTFTRRAAGELKLKIREELLSALATASLEPRRRRLLVAALAKLDSAYVGTIHSFADRLLRKVPVEASLSPHHEIAEDDSLLLEQSFLRLHHAAQHGTLRGQLTGSDSESLAMEAMQSLSAALRCGLQSHTRELEFYSYYGLDAFFSSIVRTRDVRPVVTEPPRLEFDRLRGNMREFLDLAERAGGDSRFARWLRSTGRRIERVFREDDPAVLFSEVAAPIFDKRRSSRRPKKGADCGGDELLWRIWKILDVGPPHRDTGPLALGDELTIPLHEWLGYRLVRVSPVFVSLYEEVKREAGVLDHVDLLLKLRNLIRRDKPARRLFQSLFDHIVVDEFQDTDPLQAEILLFLCERGQSAGQWEDVEVQDGRLTLVGDPKQSIYRFRRADIAMYEAMRQRVAPRALRVRLQTNFRSSPSLIGFFNDRFREILGTGSEDQDFDPDTGAVFQRELLATQGESAATAVHVLPLELGSGVGETALTYRRLEGEATANYLRWLVERSGFIVRDPNARTRRPVRFGDIAVLATATSNLHHLLRHLDAYGVPHSARGGRMLLQDPLHQQFLLGLRRLSDPFDGVAEAALLRPPFFAIDLRDVAAWRAGTNPDANEQSRVELALGLINDIRRKRHSRSPGATARVLLRETGFGRQVSLGPNGREKLARLSDLCLLVDEVAADRGLDFDAVTALVRQWIANPPRLDGPAPTAGTSVQVLTVHQAKGLEFPVVVLWDGRALLRTPALRPPWKVDRDGGAWELALEGLHCANPTGTDLVSRERNYLEHERRRVLYVACTRARDLLVVSQAGANRGTLYEGLLSGESLSQVKTLEPYRQGEGAPWAAAAEDVTNKDPADDEGLEGRLLSQWQSAMLNAAAPKSRPLAVTRQMTPTAESDGRDLEKKDRNGRFGAHFGTAVHAGISVNLRQPALSPLEALKSVRFLQLTDAEVTAAASDIKRAVHALEMAGLTAPEATTFQLEYPVAGEGRDGTLLVGSIDLLVDTPHGLHVVDFKTDDPGDEPQSVLSLYAHQLRIYRELLEAGGLGREHSIRSGILLTAAGTFCWL